MGYNITIGRRMQVPYEDEEGRGSFEDAERAELPNAPCPPGDEGTGRSNNRCPSYGAWAEFGRATGLHNVLFGADGLTHNLQCVRITATHVEQVEAARARWIAKHHKPPGYADDGSLDPMRMRLDWLAFWLRWALETWGDEAVVSA